MLQPAKDQREHVDESRLITELSKLRALGIDLRDWRKLQPEEIISRFSALKETPESRGLLATALFVGSAQACLRGKYWAPHFGCPGANEVDCRHLASPISRLYLQGKMPPESSRMPIDVSAMAMDVRRSQVKIDCFPCNPLDASAHLLAGPVHKRVAVVRYTRTRDPRNEVIRYGHCREDQLFLRTTYFRSFERMETEIHAPVGESIDLGGLIYTPGVAVMRGPLEEGAMWFQDPPRVDIIWVGLNPRPQLDEQSQYAHEEDRNEMARHIDRIFAWAAHHEVDTLVMPPLGCGDRGCSHPHLDVADLVNRTAHRYGNRIPQVCIASDYPGHFAEGAEGGSLWTGFTEAATHGRPTILRPVKAPCPAFPKIKKDHAALAEKAFKLSGRHRSTPRTFRHTFV